MSADDPLPAETPSEPGHDDDRRRYPSTIGGMFYLAVLAATLAGIVIIAIGNWRAGTRWIGGALLFAALIRLVLPARDAGMLAVRHRSVDCVMLAGVGLMLLILAGTIPNQPV